MSAKKINKVIFLTFLLLILIPCLASANTYYEIDSGAQGGFAFSYIHTATSAWGEDSDFYTGIGGGGELAMELDGFLGFSIAGNVLNVSASTLTGTGMNSHLTQNWTLDILAGSLNFGVTQGTPAGGAYMGSLDYTLDRVGGTDSLEHSGTFYFYNNQYGGPTQQGDSSGLFIWANNWNNGVDAKPGTNAIGIDLGSSTIVPEPISSTLFIVGGATLGFRRFCKKRKTA